MKVYAHSNIIHLGFLALENLLMITVPYVSNSRSYGCYTPLKLASQTLVAQRLKRWESVSSPAAGKGGGFESSLSQEELHRVIRGF